MQKTQPSITMEGQTAIFNDGRGHIVRATPEQLRAFYYVFSGWDICANDQEFFIIDLEHAFIVVPCFKELMQGLLDAWQDELLNKEKGFEAECWVPPSKYRRKLFGVLPCVAMKFTIARHGRLGDFPAWTVRNSLPLYLFSEFSKEADSK